MDSKYLAMIANRSKKLPMSKLSKPKASEKRRSLKLSPSNPPTAYFKYDQKLNFEIPTSRSFLWYSINAEL